MRGSILTLSGAVFLSACTTGESENLVFGQADTLGISIGLNTTNQTPELVLGYKGANIAVVPVAIKNDSGEVVPIGSVNEASEEDGAGDAFSVLGQFSGEASAQQQSASLGKFFATGLTAQVLAGGFACGIAAEAGATCSITVGEPNASPSASGGNAADENVVDGGDTAQPVILAPPVPVDDPADGT